MIATSDPQHLRTELRTRKENGRVTLAGTGMNGYKKGFGYYRSDRHLAPVLPVESKACPGMGWRMGIEVVIYCAPPDGWKITSVDPNVKQFLSKDGSIGSYIRSLWPQQLAPDRSWVAWFSLRSLLPEQLVTGTQSSHIRDGHCDLISVPLHWDKIWESFKVFGCG